MPLDKTKGSGAPSHVLSGEQYIAHGTVDFAVDNIDQSVDAVIQMIKLPANTLVLSEITDVETVEDSTCTLDIGDGTDPNGWDAAVDAEVKAKTVGNGALAAIGGHLYTSEDTIDITVSADTDTGKVTIYAVCVPIRNS